MIERINQIASLLGENEALIISDNINRRYFTNFPSSAGSLLITQKNSYLLIDFRYYEKAAASIKGIKVVLCQSLYTQLNDLLAKENVNKLYLETDKVSLDLYNRICTQLTGVEVSNENRFSKEIEKQRSIKSKEEIACIEKAQEITDKAFSKILCDIRVGVTEKEIALKIEYYMREMGSEGVAFDVIAVAGKSSSMPHGVPEDKPIKSGDFITMDFGAKIGGYCSDMTRTVAVGSVSQKQKKVYETVLSAQRLALESIRAGVLCKDVDNKARRFINEAGYEGCFGHGLGHSLGLEIHESPACNTRDCTELKSGMIMTVEPGIYLENEFGVRIEDMVLVTENGYQNFTKSPKELIIL